MGRLHIKHNLTTNKGDDTMKINQEALYRKAEQMSENFGIPFEVAREKLMNLSPKKLHNSGITEEEGWRPGYTKKSLEKRKRERRKKRKRRK